MYHQKGTQNQTVHCFYQHNNSSEEISYFDVNMKNREVYFATQKDIYHVPIDASNNDAVKLTTMPRNAKENGNITG